jgi:antitoxin VapB
MGLSIKNAEVEMLIRQLADQRGISMTEALRQAVAHEIARDAAAKEAALQAKIARVMAIVAELQKLPVLDNRSADEILGYDENGLPT